MLGLQKVQVRNASSSSEKQQSSGRAANPMGKKQPFKGLAEVLVHSIFPQVLFDRDVLVPGDEAHQFQYKNCLSVIMKLSL